MPNHVTNRLTFDAQKADEVFSSCCPNGQFDFGTLIPQPLHLYKGDLDSEDEQDFKCNWLAWNLENWGTKWGAYGCLCKVEGPNALIIFDTAWSIPYPVIAAFANKFGLPFEHRYFDEGHNFWGIEEWDNGKRKNKRKNNADDKRSLCIDLKKYDPEQDDEDGA